MNFPGNWTAAFCFFLPDPFNKGGIGCRISMNYVLLPFFGRNH